MVCVSAPDVCVVVVLLMLVHVVNGATELSHLTTLPVLPDKVNVPLVDPVQMLVPPLTLPPAVAGVTKTETESVFNILQAPFCTTARKAVDWVNVPVNSDVVVLLILFHDVNGEVELCHLKTFPVFPARLSDGPELPEQIGEPPPDIEPATVCGVTVIVIMFETTLGITAQTRLDVIVQVIWSLLLIVLSE